MPCTCVIWFADATIAAGLRDVEGNLLLDEIARYALRRSEEVWP
jgi:hypothetical protein